MRERERRNGLNALLVLVAVCVLFFYLFAHQVTRKALFTPGPPSYGVEDESIAMLETEDGTRLAAFWGPVPGAARTVFYFHGSAEDLGDTRAVLENYRLQGVSVLSFDYRGYGRSEGRATERNAYADAKTTLDYAVAHWRVNPEEVVFHGRGLGGGVAMELAVERPAAGLILESTFLSAFRVYLPLKWVPGDKFLNAKKARRLECPVLVIHGRRDEVAPFEHGKQLAELPPESLVKTLFLDEAGHDDLATAAGARYWAGVRGFLAGL